MMQGQHLRFIDHLYYSLCPCYCCLFGGFNRATHSTAISVRCGSQAAAEQDG